MRKTLLATALSVMALPATASEGMWMPSQLPSLAKELRAKGFKGDPQTLADLSKAPMNAVVKVGGGTGAFVSDQGLVLTNHHVAFGVIQYNSKPGQDYIRDGYVAADASAELPANPDFRVLVTTAFDRVTDEVLRNARGKTGQAYFNEVEKASKAIVAECEKEAGNRCSVVNMHYGTDFYRIRQLELRDVRLVYAPPNDIGNYGGDIDNFMWPRHTGDFTLLRAYVGKNGKPADYSKDNVPYVPPGHLQVSTREVKTGEFAMLAGYPGVTYRNRMASEFKSQVEWQLPSRVALFGDLIRTIETASANNAAAEVAYAAQVKTLKNGLKRAQGELDGLRRSNAILTRAADEAAMLEWLQRDGKDALNVPEIQVDIAAAQAILAKDSLTRDRDQLLTNIISQTQLLKSAVSIQRMAIERGKPDAERKSGYQERDAAIFSGTLKQVQRRYDRTIEKSILKNLVTQYLKLPATQRDQSFDAVFGTDVNGLDARIDALYATTGLETEATRVGLATASPAELAGMADSMLKAAGQLLPSIMEREDASEATQGDLLRWRPAYMKAMIAYRNAKGQAVYPDANSTLRVSYGQVSPMQPRDGVSYLPVTTVAGILEKETGVDPFAVPKPLKDAIVKADFGTTADPSLGTQTVNFLTDLDTTGGNSGSPVLDADGALIGLNFDSNWEAVSASWKFDPRYKRAIHVDMRYMRWLMAKVYPAPALLRELNLPNE